MRRRLTAAALLSAAVAVIAISSQAQNPSTAPAATANDDKAAIEKSAHDFATAFNKGDAQAIAAMWTANGESRGHRVLIGQAAIEKAYAEGFKANPKAKLEVLVKSVRFPAKDLAVEEGLLRLTGGPKDLPTSASYLAIHVREDGKWKIAISTESDAGLERLEDLEWLLGDWTTQVKGVDVKFSFKKDAKKPVLRGTFSRTATGKDPVNGTLRIAVDPETNLLRSWGFDDDGGHSQGFWKHDGKSWLVDVRGVLANGTPTSEVIVLQRVGPDAITWRSIDRVLGDTPMADSPPMRLTRTTK